MHEEATSDNRVGLVALGRQLRHCPSVRTLGVRPNLEDYPPEEMALIRGAAKIYYPTPFYADALDAMGKKTFPSVQCYRHLGDKIKQTLLFRLLGIHMPETRLFYGRDKRESILKVFDFPFVGKIARGSAKGDGVYLIQAPDELEAYLRKARIAYIQEYIPLRRDIRVVILGTRVVHAYWKEAKPGEFRTNVAKGGRILFDLVPEELLSLALDVAIRCGFDHVGLDICEHQGRFLFLEANMNFGTEGFHVAGVHYRNLLRDMVEAGEV